MSDPEEPTTASDGAEEDATGPADAAASGPDADPEATEAGPDLNRINQALGFVGRASRTVGPAAPGGDVLDELAEDMRDVMGLLRRILDRQDTVERRITELESGLSESLQRQSRQLAKTRQELIEEHKSLMASASFQAVNAARESLAATLDGLERKRDARTCRQLEAVLSTLKTLIQSLGFREFHAREGDAFDPERMECVGYAEGEPATVLRAMSAGYEADGRVFRPAGVVIAAPASSPDPAADAISMEKH